MILSIKTDQPEAEIGLFGKEGEELEYYSWYAHRELADTLLQKIKDILSNAGKDFSDISGVVVYRGPGSFTGLRIGITVANAMAYGNQIPIIGEMSDDWIKKAITKINKGEDHRIVLPEYGREANITKPKK